MRGVPLPVKYLLASQTGLCCMPETTQTASQNVVLFSTTRSVPYV